MEALLADLPALLITAVGAGFALVLAAVIVRRHRKLAKDSSRLLYLALDGRPEEARGEARNAPRRFAPVLTALSGSLEPPQPRRFTSDLAGVVLLFVAPALLAIYLQLGTASGSFEARSRCSIA